MPKAVLRKVPAAPASRVADGVAYLASTPLRAAMTIWHKRINWLSGTLVLTYKNARTTKSELKSWSTELRAVADEIDRLAGD